MENEGDVASARFDWSRSCTVTTHPEASATHALMFPYPHPHTTTSSLHAGGPHHYLPDPRFKFPELGKRHYLNDGAGSKLDYRGGGAFGRRAVVPRCQVEGCQVALVNAKHYHRRHKVCEMHSKAPKAVVLGRDQRFCQQCSRFHGVSEFDGSKRSCRRRLAGHNERRRKASQYRSINTSTTYPPRGCASSLLSSKKKSWIPSADLSSRCGTALLELIAENRKLIHECDRPCHHHHAMEGFNSGTQVGSQSLVTNQHQIFPQRQDWDPFNAAGGAHLTLDLMKHPSMDFGFLSMEGKSKDVEEECVGMWKSLDGSHVV